MEQTLEKTCLLIQALTKKQIKNVQEISTGHLIPTLLNKIDPIFFKTPEGQGDWYQFKKQIESFLTQNGIDENIDIDVTGIHRKEIQSIVAALFQIFAIISVFAEKEWSQALQAFDEDEDHSIVEIIENIGDKLREAVHNHKNSRRTSVVGTNKDIVNILKDLEQKDQLLRQNEVELWEKTNKIKELEQALEKSQNSLKQSKSEFEAMEKRKNEIISSLEFSFYEGKENKELQLLREEVKKLEDVNKDFSTKVLYLQGALEEKTQVAEKAMIIEKFYEQLKVDFEEAKSQREFYKEELNKIKGEIDYEQSTQRILKHADLKLDEVKEKLLEEYKRNRALNSEIEGLKNENKHLAKQLEGAQNSIQTYQRENNRSKLDGQSLDFNKAMFKNQLTNQSQN